MGEYRWNWIADILPDRRVDTVVEGWLTDVWSPNFQKLCGKTAPDRSDIKKCVANRLVDDTEFRKQLVNDCRKAGIADANYAEVDIEKDILDWAEKKRKS